MRRNRLIIFIVITSAVLTSCNGSFGTLIPDFSLYDNLLLNKVRIDVSYMSSSGSEELFRSLAEEFSSSNTYGIEVGFTDSADPDMVITGPSNAAEMLRTNQSIELSPFISNSGWGFDDGRSMFYPAARKQTQYWDLARKVTSIPVSLNASVVLVNTDLLKAAGHERFPANWYVFRHMLKNLSAVYSTAMGIPGGAFPFYSFISARGGSILKVFGFSYDFFNPAVNRTLRYIRNTVEKGIISVEQTEYSVQTGFAFGKIPAVLVSTEGIPPYKKLISMTLPGMNWQPVLLPTKRPGTGTLVNCIQAAAIMNTSPEKQLASWLFIKWLTEDQQQREIARVTFSIPANRSAVQGILNERPASFVPQWLDAVSLIDSGRMDPLPALYDFDQVSELFTETADRILEGGWVWLETFRLDRAVGRDRTQPEKTENN